MSNHKYIYTSVDYFKGLAQMKSRVEKALYRSLSSEEERINKTLLAGIKAEMSELVKLNLEGKIIFRTKGFVYKKRDTTNEYDREEKNTF